MQIFHVILIRLVIMAKAYHEIRDPIHNFIKLDSHERKVLDSRPFQRLRNIHQLAMTYLVYPGATNRRFEHSLGVMELASRVYDIVTYQDNINEQIKKLLPEVGNLDEKGYWRKVLRIAALCHDLGHIAFSHAAEKDLLPDGWSHERITREIISHSEMSNIFESITPPLRSKDIVKLALGKNKAPDLEFTDWETILSEIIVGDAFGVDRMDYLLRDSLHIGVAYGRFDYYRLIDTLRILPSGSPDDPSGSLEPSLGIEEGGLNTAESLLLARYFMYSQVYFHQVRRIYDIHLKDFLKEWLPEGRFPTTIEEHLNMTDNNVLVAMQQAANDDKKPGHIHARRILHRQHFKLLYQRNPEDIDVNPEAVENIYNESVKMFGEDKVRMDRYKEKQNPLHFPVLTKDGRIVSSLVLSQTLQYLPPVAKDYIFIDRNVEEDAKKWLEKNRREIIKFRAEDKGNGTVTKGVGGY
jgi:hypothetical protein